MTRKILLSILILFATGAIVGFVGVGVTEDGILVQRERIEKATLLFVGDIMIDRYVRTQAEKHGYENILDEELISYIKSADYAVGNLEGPVTSHSSKSAHTLPGDSHNITFTFAPEGTEALKSFGFDAFSLANNHSLNFGMEGMIQTRNVLDAQGIAYFGDPDGGVEIQNIDGISIALVGYNEFGDPSFDRVTRQIEALESTDVIIVFPHWGREYQQEPTESQRERAYAFVDAGADLIVGAHSHVVGEREVYKGVPIYYSLGNFIFDQYMDMSVRCGAVLEIELVKRGNDVHIDREDTFYTLLQNDGTTTLGTDGACGR